MVPRKPDSRALSVTWNGPSLIDLLYERTPRSVMLNPAIVLSKFNRDLLFMFEFANELFKFIFSTSD
jgi:hypothetical protein